MVIKILGTLFLLFWCYFVVQYCINDFREFMHRENQKRQTIFYLVCSGDHYTIVPVEHPHLHYKGLLLCNNSSSPRAVVITRDNWIRPIRMCRELEVGHLRWNTLKLDNVEISAHSILAHARSARGFYLERDSQTGASNINSTAHPKFYRRHEYPPKMRYHA